MRKPGIAIGLGVVLFDIGALPRDEGGRNGPVARPGIAASIRPRIDNRNASTRLRMWSNKPDGGAASRAFGAP